MLRIDGLAELSRFTQRNQFVLASDATAGPAARRSAIRRPSTLLTGLEELQQGQSRPAEENCRE